MNKIQVAERLLAIAKSLSEVDGAPVNLQGPKMFSVPNYDPLSQEEGPVTEQKPLLTPQFKSLNVPQPAPTKTVSVEDAQKKIESAGEKVYRNWESLQEDLLDLTKKESKYFGPNFEREKNIVRSLIKQFVSSLTKLMTMVRDPKTVSAGKTEDLVVLLENMKDQLKHDSYFNIAVREFSDSCIKDGGKKHNFIHTFEDLLSITDMLLDIIRKHKYGKTAPNPVV